MNVDYLKSLVFAACIAVAATAAANPAISWVPGAFEDGDTVAIVYEYKPVSTFRNAKVNLLISSAGIPITQYSKDGQDFIAGQVTRIEIPAVPGLGSKAAGIKMTAEVGVNITNDPTRVDQVVIGDVHSTITK